MRSIEDVEEYAKRMGIDKLREQRARYNPGERTAVLIDLWIATQEDNRKSLESSRAFWLGIGGCISGLVGAITGVIALWKSW